MNNLNSSRPNYPEPSEPRRLSLRLIVRPGDQVLSDLSRTIERFTGDSGHLLGVIDDNMRLSVDLSGVHPYQAENLARALIRHAFVIRLSALCFDHEGREIYAVNLYSS
jgi:hypothetical protein